ncbi:MAG: radical SAM protein [Clostridiales bacterium]|nr:radical SAM protein [Clostridiales bacterium]
MKTMKYVYGPVPSRRLGLSLGISPIPQKTCNYSCIYCQLGRTYPMINKREMFFEVSEIIKELELMLNSKVEFDVITIVGEGEPTLYAGLGKLIEEIKSRTDKPVAVITNGALMGQADVQRDLLGADIVLPSLDAVNATMFKKINRPHKDLIFEDVADGLIDFSKLFRGQLWMEIMLIKGLNDDVETLMQLKEILGRIQYDRLYLNTPVRPPAESDVEPVPHDVMERAVDVLHGISIDLLASEGFHSEIEDPEDAILSIIKRHPMNQHELESFLISRGCINIDTIMVELKENPNVIVKKYKGYETYGLKI